MGSTAEFEIIVDGLKEVSGSGAANRIIADAIHYLNQYQSDGKEVKLVLEIHNPQYDAVQEITK
jgi:hypothetical protein